MIPKSGNRFSDKIMRKTGVRRIQRIVMLSVLVVLAPVMSGCADFDMDKLDVFGLSEKRKLPGDRKPVFPEGVPGVSQGIPPEYLKENQRTPETAQSAPVGAVATAPAGAPVPAAAPDNKAAVATPAEEPKPKVRKVKVSKQKLIPDQTPKQAQQPAPWPNQDQQQQPQQQQSGTAPWPASPPPGQFSR
ncbi:MAG: hypothetical protein ABI830_05480 [Pseudolabrys sp.]